MKTAFLVSVLSLALGVTSAHAQTQNRLGGAAGQDLFGALQLKDKPVQPHGQIFEEDRGIYTFKWDCYEHDQQSVCSLVEVCSDLSCWCP